MLLFMSHLSAEVNISLEWLYLHDHLRPSSVDCYSLHFADWCAYGSAGKGYGMVKMMAQ